MSTLPIVSLGVVIPRVGLEFEFAVEVEVGLKFEFVVDVEWGVKLILGKYE